MVYRIGGRPMTEELDLLYVEDDPPSVELLREAFAECGTSARVHAVRSAPEALAFLAGDHPEAGVARPDLVLLDLDLGGSSGFDVLDALHDRGDRASPPVVLFTSSDDEDHVTAAYERGANAFVRKPDDFEGLVAFANGTARLWGSVRTSTEAA